MMADLLDVVASSDPSILTDIKQLRLGTGFLPTDAAFDKLEAGVFDKIKADPELARKTLLAHFSFSQTYFTGKLKPGTSYPVEFSVIQGVHDPTSDVPVISHDGVKVKLLQSDIALSNGVAHIIDRVLTPPSEGLATVLARLDNVGKFSSLIASHASIRDLLNASSRFTVFAPIDVAIGDVRRFKSAESAEILLKNLIVKGQFATSNLKQLVSVDEMVLPFASFLTTVSGARLDIVKIENGKSFIFIYLTHE